MLGILSWFQPAALNYPVPKWQLRIWRRWSRSHGNTEKLMLLAEIDARRRQIAAGDGEQPCWLLPYRDELRAIFAGFHPLCNEREVQAIRYYMVYCPPEMIPIGIWLIGRCADRFRLFGISDFRFHPSAQVRRQVAKALRRVEAWSLLEEMAMVYPDDARIPEYARAVTSRRPFRERLKNFARNVDDSHAGEVVTPSRMPFWQLERDWEGRSPKSAWYIRLMLWRIRRWVRGA